MTANPGSDDQETGDGSDSLEGVEEEVLQLGEDDNLVGILSLPTTSIRPAPPAVILLNAGVLHRVGPHRLHVRLARQLAAQGFPSLRFDLSGIGDSRSVPTGLTFRDSSVSDTRAAMDRLGQRLGSHGFVIFGLCSGADNAMASAASDGRVTGLVLVDPHAYATTASRVREEIIRAARLRTPHEIAAWAGRTMGSMGVRLAGVGRRVAGVALSGVPIDRGEQEQGRTAPPIAVYRAALTAIVDRRIRVLTVFSGTLHARYNHEDQIFEWFPELRGRLDRVYFPAANHTFTELASQTRLLSTVVGWVDRLM